MKAVLALLILYVGTFLIVIQGVSQNVAKPEKQDASAAQTAPPIDPAKEADIHSLMELLGVRDLVQDSTNKGIEQFRENLKATVPNSERGQQFVKAFLDSYQKKFNPDETAGQIVSIYDKHFTEEDIKGLLQFYGSPLGQKYAVEMPKINAEIQAANRSAGTRMAKEVLQELRRQYPGVGAQARLVKQHRGQMEPAQEQASAQP
jgi:uncharacterized protein